MTLPSHHPLRVRCLSRIPVSEIYSTRLIQFKSTRRSVDNVMKSFLCTTITKVSCRQWFCVASSVHNRGDGDFLPRISGQLSRVCGDSTRPQSPMYTPAGLCSVAVGEHSLRGRDVVLPLAAQCHMAPKHTHDPGSSLRESRTRPSCWCW